MFVFSDWCKRENILCKPFVIFPYQVSLESDCFPSCQNSWNHSFIAFFSVAVGCSVDQEEQILKAFLNNAERNTEIMEYIFMDLNLIQRFK